MSVYLMKRADGLWKVGYSNNPSFRRSSLQTEFAQCVSLERIWEHPKGRLVEGIAHYLLTPYRAFGIKSIECYAADRAVVVRAIEQALSFLPITHMASLIDRMDAMRNWQEKRADRYQYIEKAIGRRLTRAERNSWLEAGGMDDVPLPKITDDAPPKVRKAEESEFQKDLARKEMESI